MSTVKADLRDHEYVLSIDSEQSLLVVSFRYRLSFAVANADSLCSVLIGVDSFRR